MAARQTGEKQLLPFLKWAGGKRWLWQRRPDLFAVGMNRYVEPFLGGGAVFFAMQPKRALLSDLNADLVATYHALRSDWRSVWAKLQIHQRNHLNKKDYYYIVRESQPRSGSGKAAKFIYLNRTCFNGLYRVNLQGEFNVPRGTKDAVVLSDDDFAEVARRLRDTNIVAADFEEIIDTLQEGDFLFADPPYTVKHNLNGFLKYNERIFSWADQERLAGAICRFACRGGKALVTNAAHSSVIELYRQIGDIHITRRRSVLASENARRVEVEEMAVTVGYQITEQDATAEHAGPGVVPGRENLTSRHGEGA